MQSEFSILVKITQFLGNFLTENEKISFHLRQLEDYKNNTGIFYDYGRYIFMTAQNGMLYSQARISLRFLAHKGVVFYLSLFYWILKMLGYGKIQYFFIVLVFIF